MHEKAWLVTTGALSAEDEKLARLLTFFGVNYAQLAAEEFAEATDGPYRVLCSAAAFTRITEHIHAERVHSVFVYATDANQTSAAVHTTAAQSWEISDHEITGAMSGVRLASRECVPVCRPPEAQARGMRYEPIISSGETTAFANSELQGVPIFFSSVPELIDLAAELKTPNFDISNHFLSAAPVVMYLRWAFPKSTWHSPEAGACLIIDDPLLRPRYGFVRFDKLLALMERHDFSTSVAFIPWNWERNSRRTLDLFKQHRERYSICIHGCDHTAGEFGTADEEALRRKVATAVQRMAAHAQTTGLPHDPVMVFPQGVFSPAAIGALKQANFLAVVNTEVKPAAPADGAVTIIDVWRTAVMRYGDFPIYTRRYPRQGVENFAFDLLLGKPCFTVIHHDHCSDECARLVEFIDRLNALKCRLTWRSPAEVIRRSYRQRELSDSLIEVEMFASQILLENRASTPRTFRVSKQERNVFEQPEIRAGTETIPAEHKDGYLRFEVTLQPGENALTSVRFKDTPAGAGLNGSGLKTRLRRYLSEARDNYVLPAKSRLAALSR